MPGRSWMISDGRTGQIDVFTDVADEAALEAWARSAGLFCEDVTNITPLTEGSIRREFGLTGADKSFCFVSLLKDPTRPASPKNKAPMHPSEASNAAARTRRQRGW